MPHWRWPSWLIAVWTVLDGLFWALVWVGMINDKTEAYASQPVEDLIGAVIVGFVVWLVGMAVLGPIWHFTRKRLALCPACGSTVERSWAMCPRCGWSPAAGYPGFGFAPGQAPQHPSPYGQQYPPYGQQYPAPPAWPSSGPMNPYPQPNTLSPAPPPPDPWRPDVPR